MKNLEKASEEYADKNVTQDWGLPIEDLKKYAMEDFVAGATWYKENSKEKKMLERLVDQLSTSESLIFPSDIELLYEAKQLIENSTKL